MVVKWSGIETNISNWIGIVPSSSLTANLRVGCHEFLVLVDLRSTSRRWLGAVKESRESRAIGAFIKINAAVQRQDGHLGIQRYLHASLRYFISVYVAITASRAAHVIVVPSFRSSRPVDQCFRVIRTMLTI